ncbi:MULTISPECIES: NlpC/P60 family protein [Yersinia]|jgi:cell wall-associated NlpC family hydrolase|uniref:Outer membrane lipoprotein n=1 Tax=Yersinia frederiksenii TaxID=29484 RepID=A0AAI8ZTK7_YERFR|nr:MULTISPECIES: NlpC/P60 family protein [Yersinia]MCB5316651.1 NlpC/P60 family protein [Yersinia massiliensis]MDN0125389.1 NlpC/P60 family protein [Yersinia massiliensis]CFR09387.1 putative outer membrane lipoprotein [Yersinia frederiksenii]
MLKIFIHSMVVLTALITFSASASTDTQRKFLQSSTMTPTSSHAFSTHNDTEKLKKILTHYDKWEGVSYKLGGNSRKGIDCSAYMQRIFEDEFAHRLPRNAREQAKQGAKIKKDSLQTGDLVFFKTSRRTSHVGVYIGEGKFVHASSSLGVTISNLDSKYWGSRYEQARRIKHGEV